MDKVKHFCPHCDEMRHTHTTQRNETLNVLGKCEITVVSTIRICNECGEDLCDIELLDLTLKAAYAEYERITGEPARKGLIETKKYLED